MQHFLIDTDTGSDDAVGLIMALRAQNIHIDAITTVAGNVDLQYATHNALVSVGMAGTYAPPVYEGCGAPLMREVMRATVHGVNGFSDIDYPRPDIEVQKIHAVDAIAHFADTVPDAQIIALGPLTNIAMACVMYPDKMKKLRRIVPMGGQYKFLNPHTPVAEFNIACDPEAAQIVLQSGIYVEFVPFDPCMDPYALNENDLNALCDFDTERANFILNCNKTLIYYSSRMLNAPALVLPDAIAVAYCIDPSVAAGCMKANICCETQSELTAGELIYDRHSEHKNGALIYDADPVRFKELLMTLCK